MIVLFCSNVPTVLHAHAQKKAMLAAQNAQLHVDSCGCSDAKKNGTTKQLFTTRKN